MKKSIFFVINSLYGGGAENAASRISNELLKKYNVYVFSLTGFSKKDYEFNATCVSLENEYKGKNFYRKSKNVSNKLDEYAFLYKPVSVIGFLQNANFCVSLMEYETQKIVSIRNYLEKQYNGIKLFIWKKIIKKYFTKCDYIVSVSNSINDEMISKYKISREKCKCIYNPYDIEKIIKLSNQKLSKEDNAFFNKSIILTNMGHLSSQKGQFHLIRIMPELLKKYSNIKLLIIGNDESDYGKRIKKLVTKYGIEKYVKFTGIQSNPYTYLKRSTIFIFPSLYEGFPNALVEAMICGIPVISSNCESGPKEILNNRDNEMCGILIDDDQTKWLDNNKALNKAEISMIKNIEVLLESENLYKKYVDMSLKRVQDFSINKIIKDWELLIEGGK